MRATALVVCTLAGAIAGSGATYLTLEASPEETSPYTAALAARSSSPAAPPPAAARAETAPGLLPASERFAVYAYAADSTQPAELESMIHRANGLPLSHRRAFELDALLIRLAELDAERAVRFARTLRLETERLIPLFQFWAERDASSALAELRSIDNPGAKREIALSLLDVLGDDERSIERIAAALSPAQIAAFRLDAAVRLTGQDPFRAMQRALALDDSTTRMSALSRIAVEWTRQDPAAALAQLETIPEDLRQSYHAAVLSEWARIDPDRVFAYVRSNKNALDLPRLAAVLSSLAPADPRAVLELAEEMPSDVRRLAQQTALRVIADRDPYAAIALIDAMPSNRDREQMLSSVGQAFAQRDPDGALEWAKSLRPPSTNAIMSVVNGIASTDPGRAVDLMLDDDLMSTSSSLGLMLAMSTLTRVQDTSRIAAIADRLVERNDPSTVDAMGMLISGWTERDPEAAVEWLIGNAERAGRPAVARVASQLATEDPIAAAAMMTRLPPELHGDWLQSVAAGYAQYDAEAAASWIMQYQGRPGFTGGLAAIAPALAQTDPRAAARMLEAVEGPVASLAASQVASVWAARDPAAAANWAVQLSDTATRSSAMGSVVSNWANRDPDGARRWVLGQPRGAARDAALQRLLPSMAARGGELDTRLLDAFSSDAIRQNAVMNAALQLAGRDPDAARRLVDQHITQPQMRQQAYTMIERSGASRIPLLVR